jgi:hypothetical protein
VGIPVTKPVPSDKTVVSRLRVAHFTAVDSEKLEGKLNKWFDDHPNAVVEELRYSMTGFLVGGEHGGPIDAWNVLSVLILYRTMPEGLPEELYEGEQP